MESVKKKRKNPIKDRNAGTGSAFNVILSRIST
jgi:hypothetical protein